jgi:plastocyanin
MLGTNAVPAYAETIRMTIDKLVFSPAEIKAKVGDTVEWVNQDMAGDWDVTIPAGATARIDLKKAGSVEYYCRYHPNEGPHCHCAGMIGDEAVHGSLRCQADHWAARDAEIP